jgi:hypothetical protein
MRVFMLAFLGALLTAQAEIKTEPPIGLALPRETRGDGVHLTQPVLINGETIVTPDLILRCVYAPVKTREEVVQANKKYKSIEDTRTREDPLAGRKIITEEERANMKISGDTVWLSVTPFQLALQNLVANEIRLVAMNTENAELIQPIINLPDGLLLTERGGQVEVLALEVNSLGSRSGLRVGDRITQVGPQRLQGGLVEWLKVYPAAKKAADTAPERVVRLKAQQPGEATERDAVIKLPMSLKGGFFDQP